MSASSASTPKDAYRDRHASTTVSAAASSSGDVSFGPTTTATTQNTPKHGKSTSSSSHHHRSSRSRSRSRSHGRSSHKSSSRTHSDHHHHHHHQQHRSNRKRTRSRSKSNSRATSGGGGGGGDDRNTNNNTTSHNSVRHHDKNRERESRESNKKNDGGHQSSSSSTKDRDSHSTHREHSNSSAEHHQHRQRDSDRHTERRREHEPYPQSSITSMAGGVAALPAHVESTPNRHRSDHRDSDRDRRTSMDVSDVGSPVESDKERIRRERRSTLSGLFRVSEAGSTPTGGQMGPPSLQRQDTEQTALYSRQDSAQSTYSAAAAAGAGAGRHDSMPSHGPTFSRQGTSIVTHTLPPQTPTMSRDRSDRERDRERNRDRDYPSSSSSRIGAVPSPLSTSQLRDNTPPIHSPPFNRAITEPSSVYNTPRGPTAIPYHAPPPQTPQRDSHSNAAYPSASSSSIRHVPPLSTTSSASPLSRHLPTPTFVRSQSLNLASSGVGSPIATPATPTLPSTLPQHAITRLEYTVTKPSVTIADAIRDKVEQKMMYGIIQSEYQSDQASWDTIRCELDLDASEREAQIARVELERIEANLRGIQKFLTSSA